MVNKGNTKHFNEIRDFLNERYLKYNQKSFIENDPICIPHLFHKKEDIEIAGFLVATIAWGNRKSIIANGTKLMQWMDFEPHNFILHHNKKDLIPFKNFVHRTFNGNDCTFFIESLKVIYSKYDGLEAAFNSSSLDLKERIVNFRDIFLETKHLSRSEKHISNPLKNSSAKRLCMFLRWMVRNDNCGVDFGIWKSISPSELCLPLDVHTGNISRQLKLLTRTQNDWQAVEEITSILRTFDNNDPIKYDFALFGIGVNKELEN
ncbi:MAG: TIGR02757 family protein [Bacteroidota bacterium]|nr:TIGR02757 family protein [Bacteroidota bacterium]